MDSINKNIHVLEENIKSILNNSTVEQLREEKQKIQIDENINISEDFNILIESELEDNVDSNNLDICIPIIQTKNESIRAEIKEYIQKYGSMDKLHEKINIEREKLTKSQEEFTNCKYESIMEKKDFDEEINRIKELLGINKDNSGLTQKIGDWNQKIGEQKGKAEDIDLDAEEKDIQNSQNLLKQKKELYQFYYKIKEDFITLKSQQVNKFDAFYNLFNTYLSAITEEQVQAGSERLKTHSGELFYQNFRKTKGTKNTDDLKALLSQGTKQSILLAFRLALLKYYYPEESGVIILDDVLLDMDPKRRERSAKLLQEFSKNNQVIFTTCDPGIADILGGNQISL